MTFQLDTTGIVLGETRPNASGGVQPDGAWTWDALDPFTQGYVEAMLHTPRIGYAGPSLRFSDLAPAALARIIEDCASFEPEPTVAVTYEYGRQFWRVRQLDRLPKFPALNIILGDDGKVRIA